jgi:hypothetical protein
VPAGVRARPSGFRAVLLHLAAFLGTLIVVERALHPVGGAVEQVDGGPEQVVEIGFEAGVTQGRNQGIEDVGDGAANEMLFGKRTQIVRWSTTLKSGAVAARQHVECVDARKIEECASLRAFVNDRLSMIFVLAIFFFFMSDAVNTEAVSFAPAGPAATPGTVIPKAIAATLSLPFGIRARPRGCDRSRGSGLTAEGPEPGYVAALNAAGIGTLAHHCNSRLAIRTTMMAPTAELRKLVDNSPPDKPMRVELSASRSDARLGGEAPNANILSRPS